MKLTEISYRRLFSTGAYENQSIELTASLSENEDTLNAYTQLHKMAEELHYSKNAEMYDQRGTQVRDIVEDKPIDTVQATLYEIDKCQTIDELKGWWLVSKGNLTLSGAYKSKEKQLNDAK